jgi:hypothetical protein
MQWASQKACFVMMAFKLCEPKDEQPQNAIR